MRYFLVALSLFGCGQRIHNIDFLNPLERSKEGFLDYDTYQVIAEASFLDPKLFVANFKSYVPMPLPDDFEQGQLITFNEQKEIKKLTRRKLRKITLAERPISMRSILNISLNEIPQDKIALAKFDLRLKQLVDTKKAFLDKACRHARVRAVYRWYVLAAPTSISGEHSKWYRYLPTSKELKKEAKRRRRKKKAPEAVATSMPLLTQFSSNNFPPGLYYNVDTSRALRELENALDEDSIGYEVIDEEMYDDSRLSCKFVIHIKDTALAEQYRHLVR